MISRVIKKFLHRQQASEKQNLQGNIDQVLTQEKTFTKKVFHPRTHPMATSLEIMSMERLPNELWLEIFSYTSYLDLFHCFSGLNERINAMLYTKQIKLKLKSILMYHKAKVIMEALPEHIIDLRIEYSKQDIDISLFKNLSSLHISHPTDTQIAQIQSNYFKYLNQLNIIVVPTNCQLGDILFGKNRLVYLTTCWFPYLDSYFQGTTTYEPCLTLRSFRLNYCHINTLFKLLQFLPNLISFESALVQSSVPDQSNFFPLINHLNLIHLKLYLRAQVPLNNLKAILLCVRRLEQIYLTIDGSQTPAGNFNFAQLADILEDGIPNMKKCEIIVNFLSLNLNLNYHDLKKVKFSCPQNALMSPKSLNW